MIGKTIAHYRVLGPIGAGGMGEVYRAHDTRLGRDVALKILPPETRGDETARARLLREARAASTLNHPNLCTVHEVGEFEGQTYIAMELIAGQPLSESIPPHGLPAETLARWGAQIADALAHAHERGVIHRDLKTTNVMVTPDGRVKVLDLGLAKQSGEPGREGTIPPSLTSSGVVVGTPAYLAPELLRGEPADARSDIWALGVVLQEMATGARPFQGQTPMEVGAAILNAEPAPLPAKLPPGLSSVIRRCLAKDPAQRYGQAGEVRAALEATFGGVSTSRATTTVGPRRDGWWLAVAGAVVLVGLVLAFDPAGIRTRLFTRAGSTPIQSLAVLPLVNLSRDPEQDYFADGMTEELIARLAGLEGVRVISRTSVMRYKGTTKNIRQISRELGVDAVVEGSALRAGDRVRITAQLIQGAADRHLWANSYDRDLRDVLALQADVAQAIAAEIRATLAPHATVAQPIDPRAYEAYLKGRFEWNKRNPASLKQAIEYFRRALEIEPNYALAHAGLADVYAVMGPYLNQPATASASEARASALKALELDPQLAEPHAALAQVKANADYDWAGAESEFREALRLNPNSSTALHWHAVLLMHLGRFDEALAEIDRALAVDPLALIIRNTRGRILLDQRHWDEAMGEFRHVIEFDPTFSLSYVWIGRIHDARGQYPLAVVNFRKADSLVGNDLTGYDALQRAAAEPDSRRYWRQSLAFLSDVKHRGGELTSGVAECHARLGEADSALALLDRAFRDHDSSLLDVVRESAFDALRTDPRFVALLRRYGLEP